MHTVLAALKFVGITIVAAAGFYGVARFAKSQMGFWFWQSGPSDPPVTNTGKPPAGTQPPK